MSEYENLEKKMKELLRKKEELEYSLKYAMTRQGYPNTEYKDGYSITKELEKINEEIKSLQIQLRNTPKIIKCPRIKGNITSRWSYKFPDFSIKLYPPYNKWSSPEDLETHFRTEVVTDENNVPILIKRYLRSSDTYGMLLCYEYPIELDVKPDINEIKPKQETKQEIRPFSRSDMIEQKSYIDKMMDKVKCPRCGIVLERAYFMKSSNLLGQAICPNCTYTTDWNKLPAIDQNKKQEQNKQHKRIFDKIKRKER